VDRVAEGEVPVCVAACPKGALEFGEYTEQLASRRLRRATAVKAALASGSAR
jgi:Fe-S-cluster-containing dehydrogenase component